jgi:hypothetical protein
MKSPFVNGRIASAGAPPENNHAPVAGKYRFKGADICSDVLESL